MKLLKSYFLFFAQHPVSYNFAGWAVIFLASVVLDSCHIIPIPGYYLGIETAVFFFHTVTIYQVIWGCITRQDVDVLNDNSYLCQIAVFPDGHKEILTKPIWGKSKVYSIARMYEYIGIDKRFIVKTSCDGKYKNSTVTIPVALDFKLNGHFNQLELFNELFKDQGDSASTTFSIDRYVRNIFKKANLQSQEEIDFAVQRYALQQSTEPILLNEVISAINFPEKLFSNVVDVKICLESPSFSSCKGMSCGEEL